MVAGHDDEARRWLGRADNEPKPTACIVVGGEIVGWVDYDVDREWLHPGEVNVGYSVFVAHRGRGYTMRAVQLLMHHLALNTNHHTATVLIHPDNTRSLSLSSRVGFVLHGDIGDSRYFKRPLPAFPCTDGVVTIRKLRVEDIEMDLPAKDDDQIRWLGQPCDRERWESMSPAEQRAHAVRGLEERGASFGTGPKWTFAVDSQDVDYVAYVDCNLANEHVPHGEANIAYSSHPAHRGRGYVSRGVRLVLQFLRDNTGAREAHLIVDAENSPSLRVPRAVGAQETETFVDDHKRPMIRHVVLLRTA